MARLPEEHKAAVHTIRQDYAQALKDHEDGPTLETRDALQDVESRRARALRMISGEDGLTVRELSALFRCSKTAVRAALAAGGRDE